MRRREFIAGLLLATTLRSGVAQERRKRYRIAVASPSTPVADMSEAGSWPFFRGLFKELRRLGYVEGSNLTVERYSGEGRTERYAELARDVASTQPDLIITVSSRMARDLQAATTTIPITGIMADPLAWGLVASLSRPGGNITGVSSDAGVEICGKRLGILREMVPSVSKVGLLAARAVWETSFGREMQDAAQRLGIVLLGPPLASPIQEPEYASVLAKMMEQRVDALVTDDTVENFTHRRLIVELADKHRLPAIYPYRDFAELGGLMAYAMDLMDLGRRVGEQSDQILKGAKPAEIPLYQPTKFELVINLKTAKTLGLSVPATLLARADEVIE